MNQQKLNLNYFFNKEKKLSKSTKIPQIINIFIYFTFFCLFTQKVNAANFDLVKKIEYWNIYSEINDKGDNICHVVSVPVSTKVFDTIRNIPYFVLTYNSDNKFTFSGFAGFPIDKSKGFLVKIGEQVFTLKIDRDFFGYTYDSEEDAELVNTIMLNQNDAIEIRYYSKDGQLAVDYYNMLGLSEAIQYTKEKCH